MNAPTATDKPANWSEREMKDRAYNRVKGKTQHVYLYLIDRCEKRSTSSQPQGFVFASFVSEAKIAADTGVNRDRDVKQALAELTQRGLIQVSDHQDARGSWRVDSIELAGPGDLFEDAFLANDSEYAKRLRDRVRKNDNHRSYP